MENEVKAKLETHINFRERTFRGKYLAVLALRKLEMDIVVDGKTRPKIGMTIEDLVEFAKTHDSYRSAWDAVLRDEENKHLRGKDYSDKVMLEQEWQLAHGYQPNFWQDKETLTEYMER